MIDLLKVQTFTALKAVTELTFITWDYRREFDDMLYGKLEGFYYEVILERT